MGLPASPARRTAYRGYHIVNSHCDGADFPQVPEGWCAHRLAHALCKRATALAQPRTVPAILAEFVTTIHGREFVQFAGLLVLAHAQGLTSLKAELTNITPELGCPCYRSLC